jgi:hypothetical protein
MDIKTQVLQARQNGSTYSDILKEFGVAKSTAQDWVRKNQTSDSKDYEVSAWVNSNLSRDKQKKFGRSEEELLDFLKQLAPIQITPKYESESIHTLNDYAVVGSDFHFGAHDQKALDIFLETIYQLKPKTIILNGDTMDFLAISKYPKDLKNSWSIQKEREEYHAFLYELISVSSGAKIYETYSNHSGQSIDGRWRRYLSDRLSELSSLPDITDMLSYENVFMGEFSDKVEHVDFVDLNGLIVTHGTTVRANGGASCLGEINKWGSSILHGHTHRIGSSCKRIPAMGNRKEQQLVGIEGGCLCSLDALYATAANWQQGFNIVSLNDDTFGVEQVYINNGTANISTLGKTIKSL